MKRNRRAAVEDRWYKRVRDEHGNTQTVPSSQYGGNRIRWRARYVDDSRPRAHTGFHAEGRGARWLDKQTAAIVSGTHVAPRGAQLSVQQWCDLWIEGYKINRESTVRQARTHIKQIATEFGHMPLTAVRPSQVKA
jgi:Phage integrase, N-terminal SAM-like domain